MSVTGSTAEWREEARALERFALAVTPDARFACDHASAVLLAENLINRSVLAFHNGDGPGALGPRNRILCLFVRFLRRHVRLRSVDEEGGEGDGLRDGTALERAIAGLPLEWREALLLVVLERLTHTEAAAVLEIPLNALLDRLARARTALSDALTRSLKVPSHHPHRAPHLRVIK
jgi:hypothetical protein